jgi:hypothetical protein
MWRLLPAASSIEGGIMKSDARVPQHDPSSWSDARRRADTTLIRALERTSTADDDATHSALSAFVDLLVSEGLTPEATVIALKDALTRAHLLYRLEPLFREHLREGLVSACIDRYFATRTPDDVRRSEDVPRRASGLHLMSADELPEDSRP